MANDTAVTHDGLTVRKSSVLPLRWRYGSERDDVCTVVVEGHDAVKLVDGLCALLDLRSAVIALATAAALTHNYGEALVELREVARKLTWLDIEERP